MATVLVSTRAQPFLKQWRSQCWACVAHNARIPGSGMEDQRRRSSTSSSSSSSARGGGGSGGPHPFGQFGEALSQHKVLMVGGSNSSGRASVAAAVGLALARRKSTLLVDADDPAHGLGDAIGVDLNVSRPVEVPLTCVGYNEVGGMDFSEQSFHAVRLSALTTSTYLQDLLGTAKWRNLLENEVGAKLLNSLGIPLGELLGILDCVQPPPGAEMTVALARLLAGPEGHAPGQIVVDVGAAVRAIQIQMVPKAVATGLGAVLRLQKLIRTSVKQSLPGSVVGAGLGFFLTDGDRQDLRAQAAETGRQLEELQAAMSALADEPKGLLLILPYRPGQAGQGAARRTVESLNPTCVALTGAGFEDGEPVVRPSWLPPGPPAIVLPFGDERPCGKDLCRLADILYTETALPEVQ